MAESPAAVLLILRDIAVRASQLGNTEVRSIIEADPIAGPVLDLPDRHLTPSDIERAATLIRSDPCAAENILEFNARHLERLAAQVNLLIESEEGFSDLLTRLSATLSARPGA